MNIARRRVLPAALLGLALTTAAVAVGGPASAAGEPPTGSYTLDSTAIWTGQRVMLTQGALADDDAAPEAISRTIAWGDGRTTTAAAGETSWTHVYDADGTFPVTVALNDGDVAGTGTFAAGSAVTVGASGASYKWQKSPLWTTVDPDTLESWKVPATWQASGLPAKATTRWTEWGDDETSLLSPASSTSVTHYFGHGVHSPKVTLENKQGKAFPESSAALTVQYDTTLPAVSLTWPSNPNRASSWGTVRGKASDSQSGVDLVGVILWKTKGATEYYFNFSTRTWVRYTGGNPPASVIGVSSVTSAGVWQVPAGGLAKGWRLEIGYFAMDKVGNETETKWSLATMTS